MGHEYEIDGIAGEDGEKTVPQTVEHAHIGH
jgi:hypothetical protein